MTPMADQIAAAVAGKGAVKRVSATTPGKPGAFATPASDKAEKPKPETDNTVMRMITEAYNFG